MTAYSEVIKIWGGAGEVARLLRLKDRRRGCGWRWRGLPPTFARVLLGGYVPEVHRGIVEYGGEPCGRRRLTHQLTGNYHPSDLDLSLGAPDVFSALFVQCFLDLRTEDAHGFSDPQREAFAAFGAAAEFAAESATILVRAVRR